MGNEGKLRKRFRAFVAGLSPEECREQLVRAYLQMERCCRVLRGDDVEPVDMMDNGESSDLELFYLCKKLRGELDLLDDDDDDVDDDGGGVVAFSVFLGMA